jgi:2-hydroxy-3-keto-5-methylthiopentenyl-1-phosphate phosphatase
LAGDAVALAGDAVRLTGAAAVGILSVMPPQPVPALRSGQPPIAILVDYDGTIAQTDVADKILSKFIGERYAADDAAYDAGLVGSRTLFESQIELLPGVPDEVVALAEAQPYDPTFASFVARALELDVAVEVVSDGFGFYIGPALARMGVPKIPVVSARTIFDGTRARMEFPNGHPDCFVCGTCKRQRVLAHQAAGRTVVFVGDGESDRYAAAYSDLIFAKRQLIVLCREEGWPFTSWHDFTELRAWLDRAVEGWLADPASQSRHTPKPFICGPELWGPGLRNPPPRP